MLRSETVQLGATHVPVPLGGARGFCFQGDPGQLVEAVLTGEDGTSQRVTLPCGQWHSVDRPLRAGTARLLAAAAGGTTLACVLVIGTHADDYVLPTRTPRAVLLAEWRGPYAYPLAGNPASHVYLPPFDCGAYSTVTVEGVLSIWDLTNNIALSVSAQVYSLFPGDNSILLKDAGTSLWNGAAATAAKAVVFNLTGAAAPTADFRYLAHRPKRLTVYDTQTAAFSGRTFEYRGWLQAWGQP